MEARASVALPGCALDAQRTHQSEVTAVYEPDK